MFWKQIYISCNVSSNLTLSAICFSAVTIQPKMNAKFISLSIIILIAGFFEFIVFNEEVLLALCFISFVFFAYSYLGETIFSIFDDRAKKFESDILVVFGAKHITITSYASDLLLSKMIFSRLSLFEAFTRQYNVFVFEGMKGSRNSMLLSATISKFNEIVLTERKLKTALQKTNIQSAVYPFIFYIVGKPITLKIK